MAKPRASKGTTSTDETEGVAQFERWLPVARRKDGPVATFRLDPVVAAQNVRDGVAAVLGQRARLKKELPTLDLGRIERLPELATATLYACRRAERAADAPRGVRVQLGRASELRELMLASAESLALGGFLSKVAVSKIRTGRGPVDLAKDCVELAGLFEKNAAAIKGKSPVSREHVKEAAEIGSALLTVIAPAGTRRRREVGSEAALAAGDRDRLGALLAEDHDLLRRAAHWLFGSEADTLAPPLGSRPLVRRRATPAEPAGGDTEKPAT